MNDSKIADGVRRQLFADDSQTTYAILDGASIPNLLELLDKHEPEHTCLFAGALHPEVEMTAPYLVRLAPESRFAERIIQRGWGKHWGVFALVPKRYSFVSIRKHFRTFLRVRGPDQKPLFFRYYDPRVLRVYLPTCNEQELDVIFGPVTAYLMEGEPPSSILRFLPGEVGKEAAAVPL